MGGEIWFQTSCLVPTRSFVKGIAKKDQKFAISSIAEELPAMFGIGLVISKNNLPGIREKFEKSSQFFSVFQPQELGENDLND